MSAAANVYPIPSRRLSIDDILRAVSLKHLGEIEARISVAREQTVIPYLVRDHDEFVQTILNFMAIVQEALYDTELPSTKSTNWRNDAYDAATHHLSRDPDDMRLHERNAIMGREGGMISIIDHLRDALVKHRKDVFIRRTLDEVIPQTNWTARERLAEEFITKYARNDIEPLPHSYVAAHLEEVIAEVITHLHGLERATAY